MYRRLLCLFLLFSFCATVSAQAVSTSAASAILMDADSGRVLYAHRADEKRLIASTTKIMTALVALEQGDLRAVYTVTADDMAEGSSMYLRKGETLTLETLLYGLMLASGNDAALAVAHCVSGDLGRFVGLMNEKARALGMKNSSFANPNGLDHEKHYSTAEDMAILAKYALENDVFRRIVSTSSITIDGRTLSNHNKLLRTCEGCIGLKTGYTKAAGRTLVSAATRNGQTLIAVTLNDGNDWADHQAMFDYGFRSYPETTLLETGEIVSAVEVLCGQADSVGVAAAKDVVWPLAEEDKFEIRLELPRAVAAPVPAGAIAGYVVLFLNGTEADRIELIFEKSIPVPLSMLPAAG